MLTSNTPRLDDAELMRGVVARDHSAFAEAYRRHSASLTSLARQVLQNEALAHDAVQNVFLRLWQRPERYESARGSLRSFLCADCHFRAVDLLRSETSRHRRELEQQSPFLTGSDTTASDGVDRTVSTRVRVSLEALTSHERDAIGWAYLKGYTYREVAALLGTPEGTVKSRIRTGLKRLRVELGDLDAA